MHTPIAFIAADFTHKGPVIFIDKGLFRDKGLTDVSQIRTLNTEDGKRSANLLTVN